MNGKKVYSKIHQDIVSDILGRRITRSMISKQVGLIHFPMISKLVGLPQIFYTL